MLFNNALYQLFTPLNSNLQTNNSCQVLQVVGASEVDAKHGRVFEPDPNEDLSHLVPHLPAKDLMPWGGSLLFTVSGATAAGFCCL